MDKNFKIILYRLDQKVDEFFGTSLKVKTKNGEITILKDHVNFISEIDGNEIQYDTEKEVNKFINFTRISKPLLFFKENVCEIWG